MRILHTSFGKSKIEPSNVDQGRPRFLHLLPIFYLLLFAFGQQAMSQSGAASSGELAHLPLIPGTSKHSSVLPSMQGGLIHLDVVIADGSGDPVSGLVAKDLTLLDNGQAEKIISFQGFDGVSATPDPPIQVILLIDTLAMPTELALLEVGAVTKFLRQKSGLSIQPPLIFGISENGLWTLAHPSSDGNTMADDLVHNRQTFLLNYSSPRNLRGEPLDSLVFREPAYFSALKALGYIATEERRKPGRNCSFG
jgi:hypothetical protein